MANRKLAWKTAVQYGVYRQIEYYSGVNFLTKF